MTCPVLGQLLAILLEAKALSPSEGAPSQDIDQLNNPG
jgi:hypothetical protein